MEIAKNARSFESAKVYTGIITIALEGLQQQYEETNY